MSNTPAQATLAEGQPLTPTEEIVAGVWQRVLGVRVLRGDNFFQLGGDSLGAARVGGQLSAIFRVPLDLDLMFAHPTLVRYAAAINRIQRQAEGLGADEIPTVDRADGIPLSFLQENQLLREARALAMGRREPPTIVPLAVQLDGTIEDDRVVAALNEVIAASESLRTAFLVDPATESMRAFIAPEVSVEVENIAAEDCPEADRSALLHRLQRELVRDPMVLHQPPLLRARLVRFGPEDRVLLLAVEHLVFDGWSSGLVISAMASALSAVTPGSPAGRLQYVDWVAWQRGYLSGATFDRLVGYWRSYLAGIQWFDGLKLPPPDSELDSQRRVVSLAIPAGTVTGLRSTGLATGATMFMLVLTALVGAWHQHTGDADIIMYSASANRSRPETADLIGWLAHSVVMRFNPGDDATWPTYLHHVRERVLEALLYQDIPLPLLVKALQPEQHGTPRPCRLFFAAEPPLAPVYVVPGGALRQLSIEDPDDAARPGLTFGTRETGDGGLALQVVFDQAEVDGAFVEELAAKIGRGLYELAGRVPPAGHS